PEHCAAFAAALDARRLRSHALEQAGRYRVFDARATLERFMVDGSPDRRAFAEAVEQLIERATRPGLPVRGYGEMAALLRDDEDRSGALQVETLWNDLAERYPFALFCGYAMASFAGARDLAAAKAVCDRHNAVAPLPAHIPTVAESRADEHTRLFVAAPTAP